MKYVDDTLFKLPPQQKPVSRHFPGKHCRDCDHMRMHPYSARYNYCAKSTSERNIWPPR